MSPQKEPLRLFGKAPEDQKIIRQGQYLSVHKPTVALFGWVGAHFLCQLDFHISKSLGQKRLEINERRRWVYKSHEQWRKELPSCSKSTLKRAIKELENVGVVLSEREPWKKGYSINYEAWAYFLHNPKAAQKLSK